MFSSGQRDGERGDGVAAIAWTSHGAPSHGWASANAVHQDRTTNRHEDRGGRVGRGQP